MSDKTIQSYIEAYQLREYLNQDLLDNLQIYDFPAYKMVYSAGTEQRVLYLLVEGQVQCYHMHLDGSPGVLAVQNPFTAIGDMEILHTKELHSDVITTRRTRMLGIKREIIEQCGADDPQFLRFLPGQLRKKLYETNNIQTSHVLPLVKRLVIYILSQLKQDQNNLVLLPDKESLASLLGTSLRHLNRTMKELADAKLVSSSYPRLHIQNRAALEDLMAQ